MTMESKTKSKFRWLTTGSFTRHGEMIYEQVWTAFDRFMATSTRYVLASDEKHSKYVVRLEGVHIREGIGPVEKGH